MQVYCCQPFRRLLPHKLRNHTAQAIGGRERASQLPIAQLVFRIGTFFPKLMSPCLRPIRLRSKFLASWELTFGKSDCLTCSRRESRREESSCAWKGPPFTGNGFKPE